jgi:hypothetical protein
MMDRSHSARLVRWIVTGLGPMAVQALLRQMIADLLRRR